MSSIEIRKNNFLDRMMNKASCGISIWWRKRQNKPFDDKFVSKLVTQIMVPYHDFDEMLSKVGRKRCTCCNGFGFQDK